MKLLDTAFNGRIIQIVESLDYGDAVSNQVLRLDSILRQSGFSTVIQARWIHPKMTEYCTGLDSFDPAEEDVVLFHFSFKSTYALSCVLSCNCTKILIYHNITPHTYFRPGTANYKGCFEGRKQLAATLHEFHFYWGDSSYNVQELIDLGAEPCRCSVVPIIVPDTLGAAPGDFEREPGSWIFLGRIAPNKGQVDLVRMFAETRLENPSCAERLYLVGHFGQADPYYLELCNQVRKLKIADRVIIPGKVSNEQVESFLARASVYVSTSEHEGFGVPLIEAPLRGVPVAALRRTAIGETLGKSLGLADTMPDLKRIVLRILCEPDYRSELLDSQRRNALRYSEHSVASQLRAALKQFLPDRYQFTRVSIVICTLDRAELLDRCLEYLQYQTNQNFEIIVVNGPSSDRTDAVLDKYRDRIKIAYNPERNLSRSRNIGIELSGGDLVGFIDDDALPFDDWVDTLLREFCRRPLTLAGLGGPVYYSGSFRFQEEDIVINKFAEVKFRCDSKEIGRNGWKRSLLGTNACYRGEVLRDAGGFDEQFDYFLDESELSFRLQLKGHIIGYCPTLFVRHEFPQGHNRRGKHHFNWYSICKNTAYFIAAYSGLKGKELVDYTRSRMIRERILPLEDARRAGEILDQELKDATTAVYRGLEQGFADADKYPRTRTLTLSQGTFLPFAGSPEYPHIGGDIRRLHVCIVTKEFPAFGSHGGIGTLYYHLASELLMIGHYVSVIIPGRDEAIYRCGRFAVHKIETHSVCSDALGSTVFVGNLNWSVSVLRAMSQLHEVHPVDVVECASWDSEAIALSLIPTERRPPLVLRLVSPFSVVASTNSWNLSNRDVALLKSAESTVASCADAIIAISESVASTVEEELGIERDARWVISPCGIAPWPFFDFARNYASTDDIDRRVSSIIAEDGKLVLFLGRLEKRKGVDLLIAAAGEFMQSNPSAHLVLAGRDVDGWAQGAQETIPGDLGRRVHFLGEVDDATRDKLLSVAYCVVYPSRYESFGLVPLEAFVHGVPVVATRAGAIPEVINEGCGLLFDPEDSKALASAIKRLLVEPRLRESLSAGAKLRVRELSSRKSAIAAVKTYASLLKDRHKQASFPARHRQLPETMLMDGRRTGQGGMRVSDSEEQYVEDPGIMPRMSTLLLAPALLLWPERLLLYALVRAMKPTLCLEIGTHLDGSAEIICAALDDVGAGRLVCVDPSPAVSPERWAALANRATVVRGRSPQALLYATALVGGRAFDFVFVDGDHAREGVLSDLEAVLDIAAPGASIVLHDAHYFGVDEATQEFLALHRGRVVDAGLISTASTPPYVGESGRTEAWGGLRLLRVRDQQALEPKASVSELSWDSNCPTNLTPREPYVFASNTCRESHFRLPLYRYWCNKIKESPRYHRKQWEYVYICHSLFERGFLRPGNRGLGFGVGREPLVATFASFGAEVMATDLTLDDAICMGWSQTGEHAEELEVFNDRGICSAEDFRGLVRFRNVNMKAIPADLQGYDFCWSACAFEHLGSIANGLDFVRRSLDCVRPGGIAVHTTEFNLSSDTDTVENDPSCVIYRRSDLRDFATSLERAGFFVEPLDFQCGHEPVEQHIDFPPYSEKPHLRLQLEIGMKRFVCTSIGLIISKPRDWAGRTRD